MNSVTLRVRTPSTDAQLNALFAAAWPNHDDMAFGPIHERSLTWISAWRREELVGYVNVATDGARWLHVDYQPHLDAFYRTSGFTPTTAGLMRLPSS